ncbi:RHS repeat-associated core domain-containing protein [Paraburkholderia antibiotica]|uniref:RHS repeat-associated core domain-containing protein n=1 Tax=Paraburkholderia antibiotica TaxID=2728839 RepID=A0A7Y0A311_9BURK|nr:RHS repeat-associated core domain-containing protein [Paraburkholderia antibiotica]NML35503.1 hypothetical protein [Paraburkholderia antibiotica]
MINSFGELVVVNAAWLRANPGEKYPPLRYNRRGVEDTRRLDAWEASLPKCIGNVLKELNRTRYAHDAHGNLVRRVDPDGTTWLYRYDAANRLIEAKRYAKPPEADELARREPVAGGGTRFVDGSVRPLLEVSFAYDAFGRRTKKKVTRPDGGIERTFFTWDGDVLLMEERFGLPVKREHVYRGLEFRRAQIVREEPEDVYSLPVAQRMHTLDTHHEWQAASLYLHEPGSFVPLARLDEKLVEPAFLATGTDGGFVQVPAKTRHATYFYQNDHLGTPQEMVDESGKVVWLARYKAWGGVKPAPYGKADPVVTDNRIRFQGQYHDEETGLAYNRHRYYDPQNGRFISKDPIGLAGGINGYQYAPNPVQWIDPLGLAKNLSGCDASNRPLGSSQYSVLYEAQLAPEQEIGSDTSHFREANRQMDSAMSSDSSFKQLMDQHISGVSDHVAAGPRGGYKSSAPPGFTWHHHPCRKGVMQLVPLSQHQAPGPVQAILHPGGQGGMQNWGGREDSLMNKLTRLKDVLQDIDQQPWDFALYMPHGVDWNEDTQCAVLNPDDFENEPDPDRPIFAVDHGLHHALGIQVVKSIVENAKLQLADADASNLVSAFVYYYDNDAYIDWSTR